MLTHLAIGAAGILILVCGGELLVKGAAALARVVGISPLVVGLTVVAGLFAGGAVVLGLWAFSMSSFSELGSGG